MAWVIHYRDVIKGREVTSSEIGTRESAMDRARTLYCETRLRSLTSSARIINTSRYRRSASGALGSSLRHNAGA